jgi:cobalt-zinc-cadmium efflux system outer membrane protein
MGKQLLFILFFASLSALGQRNVTLDELQTLLQKNNLALLAETYNVTIAEAAVIQAKIWDQPYLNVELNVINPQKTRGFDVGEKGQKAVAIQQLIYLGGKKRNEVEFARSNGALAQLQLEQLVRNLNFQLTENFYSLYFDRQKVDTLDMEIKTIDTLVGAYKVQVAKGNVPLKDLVRLESLLLSLNNEKNAIQQELVIYQSNLALLTGSTEEFVPSVNALALAKKYATPRYVLDSIVSMASLKNPEYLAATKMMEIQSVYVKWQKSMAVPNLTAGLSYDQRGGAFQNQVNVTLGIPLPLWNRNKGMIKMAEAQRDQSNLNFEYQKVSLKTLIYQAYTLWQHQQQLLSTIGGASTSNLEQVYQGTVINFQKRNIALLEFTDFVESYSQRMIEINDIKKQSVLRALTLNYHSSFDVFN